MEIARHDAAAVIDVHHASREEERVHQGDDAAVGGENRRARRALVVDAEVPARDRAVEHAARSELARHARLARAPERLAPHRWRIVRAPPDLRGELILPGDPGLRLRAEWLRELPVDGQPRLPPWRRPRRNGDGA